MSDLPSNFWSKVRKDAHGGCWEWTGRATKLGYGMPRINGKSRLAHRLVLQSMGLLRADQFCCHKCDNQRCVNPSHLYAGNAKTNAIDRDTRKGIYQLHGEDHGGAILTARTVNRIRASYLTHKKEAGARGRVRVRAGVPALLMKKFKVGLPTLEAIIYGRLWKKIK